ncbi:hypothetical protein [Ekhidna sp.]
MRLLILVFAVVVFGCSNSKNGELIEKSKELHESALDVGQQVSEKIQQISDRAEALEEPQLSAIKDSVEVLLTDWGTWQESIVEVPGHDDHDHHGHDHDHDHGSSPDLTPAMVLEIQQDLQRRAMNLDARAQRILNTLTETK